MTPRAYRRFIWTWSANLTLLPFVTPKYFGDFSRRYIFSPYVWHALRLRVIQIASDFCKLNATSRGGRRSSKRWIIGTG